MFSPCYPKCLDMTSRSTSIPALTVSVKLQWCQQILQGAFAAPWDGEAALCLSGRLRYGGISVVDHTHRKSHLQSHWVMAIFCCPGAFHTPGDRTQLFQQLSALCSYLSTHPGASGQALLSPLLKQALTPPRIHSLLTLFHFYLAVVSPRLSQFLLSSYLPFIPSHSQSMSALIQINFKTHLFLSVSACHLC